MRYVSSVLERIKVDCRLYNYDFWKTTMVSYMSEKIRWKKYWDRHQKHFFAPVSLLDIVREAGLFGPP